MKGCSVQVNRISLCSLTDCGVGEEERGSRAEAREENVPCGLRGRRSSFKTRRWRLTLTQLALSSRSRRVENAVKEEMNGGGPRASPLQPSSPPTDPPPDCFLYTGRTERLLLAAGGSSCWTLKSERPGCLSAKEAPTWFSEDDTSCHISLVILADAYVDSRMCFCKNPSKEIQV